MATYYVSYSIGSDSYTSAQAQNSATPWKTTTKIDSQTFVAGDTILFKRGDTFPLTTIIYPEGGSVGNPITFGAYDTGNKPILTGFGMVPNSGITGSWTNVSGNIWTMSTTNITLRLWLNGIEARRCFSTGVTNTDVFYFNTSTNKLYLYSVGNPATYYSKIEANIHDKIFYCNYGNITFDNLDLQAAHNCIRISNNADNFIINNCNIGWNCDGRGILVSNSTIGNSCDNGIISNCNFISNDRIIYTGIEAQSSFAGIDMKNGASNWQIYNNYFENWGHSCIDFEASLVDTGYTSSNISIHNNYFTCPDIYYGRGIGFSTAIGCGSNNEIYNNYIYNCPTSTQINGGEIKIHHNIFDNNHRESLIVAKPFVTGAALAVSNSSYNVSLTGMQIYNNVFANAFDAGFDFGGYDGSPDMQGLLFINNILYNNGSSVRSSNYQLYIYDQVSMKGNTFKNNLFYKSGISDLIRYGNDATNDYPHTVAEFNAENGNEGDIISGNIEGNPLFVSATDFGLQLGSPARNAGLDVGLNYAGSAPDIGATDGIYYVSNSGSDSNSGSYWYPFATISKVNSLSLAPGNQVLFKRGDSWREQLKFQSISGTSGNTITIGAYGTGNKPILYGSKNGDVGGYWTNIGGNKWASPNSSFLNESFMILYNTNTTPQFCTRKTGTTYLNTNWDFWYDSVIDRVVIYHSVGSPDSQANGIEITGVFNVNSTGTVVYLQWCDYWNIQDLDIRYSNNTYIGVFEGHHISVSNCEGRYCWGKGIDLYGNYQLIENCYLYRTGYIAKILNQSGEAIWMQGSPSTIFKQTGTIIRNNEIELCHNVGINLWGADDMIVENNNIHGVNYYPPSGSGNSGIYFDGCTNSICRYNVVSSESLESVDKFPNGFAVNTEISGMTCHDITFHNNISINCEVGYAANSQLTYKSTYNNYFHNNMTYNSIAGRVSVKIGANVRKTFFKNNIFYDISNSGTYMMISYSTEADIFFDNNCWYSSDVTHYVWNNTIYNTYALYKAASKQDYYSITTNPLFISSTNFSLQSSSPAINAGTNVGLSYLGTAPDMGAIEYGTYFVETLANGGSDSNNGSWGSPWLTLAYACSQVTTSGKTIHIGAGIFNEPNSCSVSAGVNIVGEGRDSTIINTTYNLYSLGVFNLQSGNGSNGNQSISNIKIDGGLIGVYGITIYGRSNVSIHDCTFSNMLNSAVIFDGKVSEINVVKATGNTFYNNYIYNCSKDEFYVPDSAYYATGSLCLGYQKDMLVYDNTIDEQTEGRHGYPIKFTNNGWNEGMKIYGNLIKVTPDRGVPNSWDFAIEFWNGQGGGLEIYSNRIYGALDICDSNKGNYEYGAYIHDNVLGWDTLATVEESCIVIESTWSHFYISNNHIKNVAVALSIWNNNSTPNDLHHLHFTNNVIYNVGTTGMLYGGSGMYADATYDIHTVSDIYFLNNTWIGNVASNPLYAMILILFGSLTNCYIQNNIVQGFRVAPIEDSHSPVSSGQTVDYLWINYNDFYGNIDRNYVYIHYTTPTNYTSTPNYTNNPLFVSSTNFSLQSSSTLINAGVDAGLPYLGSAPDIGAIEYGMYFVETAANGGNDSNDGTWGSPWLTLYHACAIVTTTGKTIHIGWGEFLEPQECFVSEGVSIVGEGVTSHIISTYVATSDTHAAINLFTYVNNSNGNQSISFIKLDGKNLTATNAIRVFCRNNVKIHDLTIVDFQQSGIGLRGSINFGAFSTGNEIYNCNIINSSTRLETGPGVGLIALMSQDGTLIHDNILNQTGKPMGYNGSIIDSVQGSNKGIKYYNNKSYKPLNEGIDYSGGNYGAGLPTGWNFHWESWNTLGGVEVYNNEFHGGACSLDIAGQYSIKGNYDYAWWVHDNLFILERQITIGENYHGSAAISFEGTVEDCIVNNNHVKNYAGGIGHNIGQNPRHENNIRVYNNVFENIGNSDNLYSWIVSISSYGYAPNYLTNIYYDNNTMIGKGATGAFFFNSYDEISNIYIRNNIIKDIVGYGWLAFWLDGSLGGASDGVIKNIYLQNNDIYNNVNSNAIYYRNGKTVTNLVQENNKYVNPLFVSTTNFKLLPSSTLINAGTYVGLPYTSSAPDIGANETGYYYIATFGNDTTGVGSLENPWASLHHACSQVTLTGSTICIRPGIYNENQQCNLSEGVSIIGSGSRSTILTWTYQAAGTGLGVIHMYSSIEGSNGNQSISNLTIDGLNTSWYAPVVRGRKNVSFHDLIIKDFLRQGVTFSGRVDYTDAAPTIYSTGNSFYNNTVINCAAFTNGGGNLQVGGQEGMLIYGNTITQTGKSVGDNGYCIKYYLGGHNKGNKIYNNIFTKAPYDGTSFDFALELWYESGLEIYNNIIVGSIDVNYAEKGVYDYSLNIHHNTIGPTDTTATEERGIYIEYNSDVAIIADNMLKNLAVPISFIPRSGSVINNTLIRNNMCSNIGMIGSQWGFAVLFSGAAGITDFTVDRLFVYNNTFTASPITLPYYGINLPVTTTITVTNIEIKNNIIQGFNAAGIIASNASNMTNVNISYNNLYGNGYSNLVKFTTGTPTNYTNTNNITTNPLFNSTTDFRLQATSPAINKGQNVGLTYLGSAPDIGAFEYNAIYFDSIYGNDSGSGTTVSPYKSINKLNSVLTTVNIGSTIYLKSGSEWSGSGTTINITKSGTAASGITLTSYGVGEKPIISGFVTLTGWTNESGGIYSNTISCETTPNIITINGTQYGMGRYPNVGTDLIYQSFVTNVSITSSSLNSSVTNWTGAEAFIRKNEYIGDRCKITNHTNQTLTYTDLGTQANSTAGYYFFIQNDLRCVTQFGEWYYNTGSTKIYVYFGANDPETYEVKVPAVSQLFVSHSKSYITVSGLTFEGTCTGKGFEGGGVEPAAMFIDGTSSYYMIKYCDFNFCGANGITLQSSNSIVDNNTINHIVRIALEPISNFITITNNVIKNSGVIEGSPYSGARTGGFWNWGNDVLIQYNTIDSVPDTAIAFWGSRVIVKNNYITNWALNMNDCAAIYTDGSTPGYIGRVIEGNIMIGGYGKLGISTYGQMVAGIYLDSYSNDVLVKDNTVSSVGHSNIFISNGTNINLQHNTTYDSIRGINFLEWSSNNSISGITMNNNVFFAKNTGDYSLIFQSNLGTIGNFGVSDYNYFVRPINDTTIIETYEQPLDNNLWQQRTLANWQSYTGQDAHSHKSPVSIASTSQLVFEYNTGLTNRIVPLLTSYKDVSGITYTGSVTIAPYSSIILMETGGIYFDSVGGNDSWSGTTTYPYKSITKLNTLLSTATAGSTFYLKRGSEWSGSTIYASKSGTVSAPIIIDAYGSGANPILTGFQTISGWIQSGSTGIWYKIISAQSAINMVTIDGVQYTMGRYPTTGWFYYESFTGSTAIKDIHLSATTTNWTGGDVVSRKTDWGFYKNSIISQVGTTLNLTGDTNPFVANWGYFIQNHLATLDTFGEWFYSGGTFYMYFGANNPNSYTVKVSVVDELITLPYNIFYVNIYNLQLIGANKYGIHLNYGCRYNIVENCNIDFSGLIGVYNYSSKNSTFNNLTINHSNDIGIFVASWYTDYSVVSNCTVSNTGLIIGQGNLGFSGGVGMYITDGINNLVQYNKIYNSGYIGICMGGVSTGETIRNNYIDTFCINKTDGGGIYYGSQLSSANMIIEGNIVLNGIGGVDGAAPGTTPSGARGIYLDFNTTQGAIIRNNTVANTSYAGIFTFMSQNILISGNTVYDCYGQWIFQENNPSPPPYTQILNITSYDNIFVAKELTQHTLKGRIAAGHTYAGLGTFDRNIYARPLDDATTMQPCINLWSCPDISFSTWKSSHGQDPNGRQSPMAVSSTSQILFEYNSGKTSRTVILSGSYMKMDGSTITNSVTLAPYSSIILLKILVSGANLLILDLTGKIRLSTDSKLYLTIN